MPTTRKDRVLTVVIRKEVAWRRVRVHLIYRREPIVGQGKVHKDIVHLCKLNELVQFLDTISTGVELTGTVLDKLQETARLRNFGDVYST